METFRDALLLSLSYAPLALIAALPWLTYHVIRNRLRARRRRPD